MKTKESEKSPKEQPRKSQPSIQDRAYELYLKRGQEPGHELEDWLQAEQEIQQSKGSR